MFTGIIQALGQVVPQANDRLVISVTANREAILGDVALGDSVAVDGVCLTVEQILAQGFMATVSPETLRRTTLGQTRGKPVNLETSLRVGGKVGGHFVSGHVDGWGLLQKATPQAQAWDVRIARPDDDEGSHLWETAIAPYLVPKGSIAVNGISLTVVECDPGRSWFSLAVIPHTYHYTNLAQLRSGERVNLESDLLGKYVGQLIRHPQPPAPAAELSRAFLQEHGYL